MHGLVFTLLSVLCRVCHVFPPLVSIFGLFPVLVSCHYELSMFQLCLSRYVLITLCILVLSFEFISSGLLVTPRCILSVSLALSCLVKIKDYYLSLSPRLRVPVPPSCVHRDTYRIQICKHFCVLLVKKVFFSAFGEREKTFATANEDLKQHSWIF